MWSAGSEGDFNSRFKNAGLNPDRLRFRMLTQPISLPMALLVPEDCDIVVKFPLPLLSTQLQGLFRKDAHVSVSRALFFAMCTNVIVPPVPPLR